MKLLFVCAGNICRSPMAEALFRDAAAKHASLADVEVASAGVIAIDGNHATPEAVAALRDDYNLDISTHRATLFDGTSNADLVVALDGWVEFRVRDAAPCATVMLIGDLAGLPGVEVADPYGGSLEEYREAAGRIEQLVTAIAARLALERERGR